MYDLTIIKQNGGGYIDSREVAALVGKPHRHLLRDIRGYAKTIEDFNAPNFGRVDFFLESAYTDVKGETRPCFLLSKMGCEMVANKLTGEKGVLFTAAYVAKFNEMEAVERAAINALRAPRLGEYNAAARIIVRALQNSGATSEQIIGFLKGVYEPLGISILDDEIAYIPQMYTAKQIAKMLGVYTLNGNPHYQAVSAILNELIEIGDWHKSVLTMDYGDHIGVSVRYDEYAVNEVRWFLDGLDYPFEVYGERCVYRIVYAN